MAQDRVFLLDVDNTLFDNDTLQQALIGHLEEEHGPKARTRYWKIFTDRWAKIGYADYLGALQLYREEELHDPRILRMSSWMVDYPFADLLHPKALEVIAHLGHFGRVVILSDGDAVFQPRKIERAGLWEAVGGHVLIYIHKEEMTADIEAHYPADHYVVIDDKLKILSAMKSAWKERVTTIFPRQGHYASDPSILAAYPPADLSVAHIADLLEMDLNFMLPSRSTTKASPLPPPAPPQTTGDPHAG
ncbi:MAG: haloacid dehalogenase-like hydrolase [Leptospirillia bacterium]